jgi:galactose mutarotase-like enzyme
MVFTGDIPSVERRALAIEPMTCPPNAFRSGEALVTLEPGDSHTAAWAWHRRSKWKNEAALQREQMTGQETL